MEIGASRTQPFHPIIMLAAEQPAPARRSLQADAMGNVNAVEGSYFNGVPINKICASDGSFLAQFEQ
jgi:hypothetical protein